MTKFLGNRFGTSADKVSHHKIRVFQSVTIPLSFYVVKYGIQGLRQPSA